MDDFIGKCVKLVNDDTTYEGYVKCIDTEQKKIVLRNGKHYFMING